MGTARQKDVMGRFRADNPLLHFGFGRSCTTSVKSGKMENTRKEVTLATLSIIFSGTAHSTQNERPDIIVIIADDMGYSDITLRWGNPTPNLQAMAEKRRADDNITRPMSAPACAMLTGKSPSQQAGIGGMWWYENTIGKEGYELRLD